MRVKNATLRLGLSLAAGLAFSNLIARSVAESLGTAAGIGVGLAVAAGLGCGFYLILGAPPAARRKGSPRSV